MVSIGQVVIGVDDMRRAVRFWTQALHYIPRSGAVSDDWTILDPVNGLGTPLALDVSESPVQEHPRMHLDLFTENADEHAAEVERLIALGAQKVDWDLYPADPDFTVLADPEGNRFCVIDLSHG
ncbi:VOC family protein [Nonomuraea africana]|uniref:Catechol 2,3-dioxygenase-like lactoylglutathione lyase family enzyme n=1 Tax=Nonomuraea africana TaxID=46171 RepID=A0ABR9KA61_9ACTN|nr:VOC family protein [Nonomuraea africana]MBE1558613.1 catechol 2,3-dioxygenase-like lactoylglutathione lyase family enzyme [Nonomuraea africana]